MEPSTPPRLLKRQYHPLTIPLDLFKTPILKTSARYFGTVPLEFTSPNIKDLYSDRFIPMRCEGVAKNLFGVEEGEGAKKNEYENLIEHEILDRGMCFTKKKGKDYEKTASRNYQMLRFKSSVQGRSKTPPPIKISPFSDIQNPLPSPLPDLPDRTIPCKPFKTLDAPALEDDFYLNLLDWSSKNVISVILNPSIFFYNFETHAVSKFRTSSSHSTSLSFDLTGLKLFTGNNAGSLEVFDVEKGVSVYQNHAHSKRISTIAANVNNCNLLATGSKDKTIKLFDLRTKNSVRSFIGHKQEVCGLKWSPDLDILASGGNDNKVFLWSPSNESAMLRIDDHNAAVKALAWSTRKRGLLTTGGGTNDTTLKFWNVLMDKKFLKETWTGSQVCNVMFAKTVDEVVSTHGFEKNEIVVWDYKNLERKKTLDGHLFRVLYLCMSPNGRFVCTGSGDETLKFWDVFPEERKKRVSLLYEMRGDLR